MRMIDADELEFDTEWSEYMDGWTSYSQLQIDNAPTIDAVPVVRCGECKYMRFDGKCTMFADDNIRPSVSDFCSYGERKIEND